MNCSVCGNEILDGARFCVKCGAEVTKEIFCIHCGSSFIV